MARPRRKYDPNNMTESQLLTTSVRVPAYLLMEYDRLAERTGVSRSDLIHAAMREHLPKAQRAAGIIMHPIAQGIIRCMKSSASEEDKKMLQELIDMYEYNKRHKQQTSHPEAPSLEPAT